MAKQIRYHTDLEVYQNAMALAMEIVEFSKALPRDEMYSLTSQMRKSSRSVCANLAEAWRKRRYEAAFISKVADADAEAAETQVWIEFAVKCKYLSRIDAAPLYRRYDKILRTLVGMMTHPETWAFPSSRPSTLRRSA
ncbi:MAG: four helix bundle protein [Phycisphaerales bacterium]|nr:four helix bundle protein [Phycisphaerales bacterium]MCI0629047.1 four helix bundle protein [Phycisphaerales bacterium]MCI0676870.1 four helix bundle protein [Phycisphaerales bacterium]